MSSTSHFLGPAALAQEGPRAAWILDAPEVVYQTNISVDGTQDSATPLLLKAHFSSFDLIGASFAGAVRRFDGAEISDYDEASHTMQGLRMPTAFKFATVGDELTVEVHRKFMPVSKSHGNAPFVIVIVACAASGESEVLVTSPFLSCSKQTQADRAPRGQAKRLRGRPSAKPVSAPPCAVDLLVSAHFAEINKSSSHSAGPATLASASLSVSDAVTSVTGADPGHVCAGSKRRAAVPCAPVASRHGKRAARGILSAPRSDSGDTPDKDHRGSASPESDGAASGAVAGLVTLCGITVRSALLPLSSPDFTSCPPAPSSAAPPPLQLSRSPALRCSSKPFDEFDLGDLGGGPPPPLTLRRSGSSIFFDVMLPGVASGQSASFLPPPPIQGSGWRLLRGGSLEGGALCTGSSD